MKSLSIIAQFIKEAHASEKSIIFRSICIRPLFLGEFNRSVVELFNRELWRIYDVLL